jgi:putative DNA primase/helicase
MNKTQSITSIEAVVVNTPDCLKQRPQWVCWKYVDRDGRPTKCPVNARSGEMADSTSPDTWASFDQAIAAARSDKRLAGVGYVFEVGDPYCGIDLDGCIDPTSGEVKPWARRIIGAVSSYCEVSPSGAGVKIFVRATKPGARCRSCYEDGQVEIYDRYRFFTVTGARLEKSPGTIESRQDQLNALYIEVFGEAQETARTAIPSPSDNARLADAEILRLASTRRNRGAEKFAQLWAGNWAAHFRSQSEADSSVVFTLARYTGDAVQIDRMFRESGLMRGKWDESRSQRTYGQMTIDNALAKVRNGCTPKPPIRKSGERDPRNRPTPSDPIGVEPVPGTIDPATHRLILSTRRTLPTAESFIERFFRHADGCTLHHHAGRLVAWRDNRYVEIEDGEMQQLLLRWTHQAVRMVHVRGGRWEPEDFPANPMMVNAALETIKAHTYLPVTTVSPSWLGDASGRPSAADVLPCRSLLLHLPTMERLPPTPLFFTFNALSFDPDPNAGQPERWIEFLRSLFGDDTESLELIREWFGYCLTPDTSLQKILLIIGPRRSGKSTLARVLTQLIGAGNVCGPTTSSLAGNFGLQPLIGKSLAVVADSRFCAENVGVVVERLLCVSGEDLLTIDRKYKTPVTMKLQTRFMFLSNELPQMVDSSAALASRFMILRLSKSFFGREDKDLAGKLITELPGILNWAIQGKFRLRERGHFVQPSSVEDAVRDIEDLSSPVRAFVRTHCEVGPGKRVGVNGLYEAWKTWCDGDGRSAATTKQSFGRDLLAAVPGVQRRRGTNMAGFYEGIGLKEVP